MESELFGHVAGSFTGATGDKIGKFLQADGGTIFLDEIATASQSLQVKLLRVLQDREFEPVGGNKTHKVDVRLILATNADLEEMVAAGEFREDLYYRINVISVTQPPLRERIGDIPLLIEHYLQQFNDQTGKEVKGFDETAMHFLQQYDWPGNVRELVNVVERAVVLVQERVDHRRRTARKSPADRSARGPVCRAGRGEQSEIRDGLARTANHRGCPGSQRLEPPEHREDARHQPHHALQENEKVRHRIRERKATHLKTCFEMTSEPSRVSGRVLSSPGR